MAILIETKLEHFGNIRNFHNSFFPEILTVITLFIAIMAPYLSYVIEEINKLDAGGESMDKIISGLFKDLLINISLTIVIVFLLGLIVNRFTTHKIMKNNVLKQVVLDEIQRLP